MPKGEFHAVRGSMGLIGGTKDILCQEILEPCAAIANKIFQGWPVKLKQLPACVSLAFDGSKRLSYTTILVTIGNEKKLLGVDDIIDKYHISHFLVDKAGKYIHVDWRNATNTPCVAIMIGAYSGFKFAFPTIGLECNAPSGSIVVGPFSDLLHAVSGGTGIRLTSVFCQHEDLVSGFKRNKDGNITHFLTGARRSVVDERNDKEAKGGNKRSAKMSFLAKYEFI